MQVADYYYCTHCGYEDFDVEIGFSRNTANGSWYFCPKCNHENHAEFDDNDDCE